MARAVAEKRTLPRQASPEKVHEHVAERLQVVAAALLDAKVRVEGRVTSGAGEALVVSVGNVGVGLAVTVLLGQTEINQVHSVHIVAEAQQEVVGFHIPTRRKGEGKGGGR